MTICAPQVIACPRCSPPTAPSPGPDHRTLHRQQSTARQISGESRGRAARTSARSPMPLRRSARTAPRGLGDVLASSACSTVALQRRFNGRLAPSRRASSTGGLEPGRCPRAWRWTSHRLLAGGGLQLNLHLQCRQPTAAQQAEAPPLAVGFRASGLRSVALGVWRLRNV